MLNLLKFIEMKNSKFRFFAILIAISLFSVVVFSSCDKPVTTTVTTVTTKATMTEPGTNGFLISQEIVVKGNTVWGFSEKAYGTGMQWRDIVAQNPFLQQPGRVYYNEAKRMWIVKIYPGEIVKIGSEIITPSCVFEETTTTIEKTISEPIAPIPYWYWSILAGLLALAVIIWLLLRNRPNNHSHSTTGIRNVDMNNGESIDTATNRTILEQRQVFWNKALSVADKANISSLDIHLGVNDFDVKASYFEQKCQQNTKKEIKKPETEDKKDDAK